MLIRFTVENFLSFNQRIDFNMIASDDTHHSHHVVVGESQESIKLLRTSIIYGANASGKSNLIKAMKFARNFIVEGVEKNTNININNFKLDKSCYTKPSRFEFEFKTHDKQYAYGFLVDKHKIHEEWLFEIGVNMETPIYERKGEDINFHNFKHEFFLNISEDEKNRIRYEATSTRENLLFLTNSQERKIKELKHIFEWFSDVLKIVFPNSRPTLPFFTVQDSLSNFLESLDLGIKKIITKTTDLDHYKEIPSEIKDEIKKEFPYEEGENNAIFIPILQCIISKAKDETDKLTVLNLSPVRFDKENREVEFEISEESDGTQRLIDLFPMLMHLARGNAVYVIDEIERSLHSLLMKKLFNYFLNNPENTSLNSQLIATTHEVYLLDIKDIFRKDEIWFVEKDKHGQSVLYSLANTDVDNLDLAAGYLNGRFGAIPFIKDLKTLGWSHE
ncbi:ATP-binding protein [Anabaenopsis tanganyikae CS-531]|uniref:ATP-binding protein n=2 Tax=Anabaenopsis TaxID=110103 RepID=A0ABT6KBW7_9CYAN|nr:ATP-binding protein [Anabaenopsis tanganyikae]MDH6105241.1 ATP-binding protein [Anabaenopsis tanganyikae CS-531]